MMKFIMDHVTTVCINFSDVKWAALNQALKQPHTHTYKIFVPQQENCVRMSQAQVIQETQYKVVNRSIISMIIHRYNYMMYALPNLLPDMVEGQRS